MKPTVHVVEAPIVEEVPVFVKFYYPRWVTSVSIASIIIWIGLIVWATVLYGLVGLILSAYLGGVIPRLLLPSLVSHFSGPVNGGLRLENKIISLSMPAGSYYPVFSALEWQSSKQFVVKMGLKRVQMQFANENDAARAMRLIRSIFPSVLELTSTRFFS